MFQAMRFSDATIDRLWRPALAATLLFPAIIGSAASFIVSAAILLAMFRLANSDLVLTRDKDIRTISLLIAVWFFVEAFFGLMHFGGEETVKEIIENLPYCGFLLLASTMESTRREAAARILLAAPAAAAAALMFALAGEVLQGGRAEGAAGNAGPFSTACLIVYGCCLIITVEPGERSRLYGLAGAAAAAVCVILAGVRGLWPCLFVVPLMLAVIYRHELRQHLAKSLLAFALVSALVTVVSFGAIQERVEKFAADLRQADVHNFYKTATGERFLIWRAGWALILEAPISGYGIGRIPELMKERTASLGGRGLTYSHFHNAIITQGVRTGIIGILALIAMFFAPLWLAWRHKKDEIGRRGFAVLAVTTAVYAFSGATGIMFGHDIMDALWISAVLFGSFLVFGNRPPHGADAGDRAA